MSNYKTIDKVKYDRKIIEHVNELAIGKEQLSTTDVKTIYNEAIQESIVSPIVNRTFTYILGNFHCSPTAERWLLNKTKLSEVNQPELKPMVRLIAQTSLRKLLKIADDGTIPNDALTISKSTLSTVDGKGAIPNLIKTAFDGAAIKITNAKANAISSGSQVIITGKSTFTLASEAVETTLTLKVVSNNVQALFQYEMIGETPTAKPWKFSDSFPDLPTVINPNDPGGDPFSPLDKLVLSNAQFLVTTNGQTLDKQKLIAGINFRADMTPTGILNVFESKFQGIDTLKVQATIVIPDDSRKAKPVQHWKFPWDVEKAPSGINLTANLGTHQIQLGKMTFGVKFFRIYSAASEEWFGKNSSYETTVAYTGGFKIRSANAEVDVVALAPPETKAIKIQANFDKSPIGQLSELIDIIGIETSGESLPTRIQEGKLGGLGLKEVFVIVGLEEKKPIVKEVQATVAMPQINWSIWTGQFVVYSVEAVFDVQNPFKSERVIDVLITGITKVKGKEVDIKAHSSNEFTVSADTPDKFNVPLKELMETYANGIPPVSDLTIDSLDLMVAPGKYFSITTTMDEKPEPWIIPLGSTDLKFSDVSLFLLKTKGENISGSFSGDAEIAGVTLHAEYDIPGDVKLKGSFPAVTLTQLISGVTHEPINLPKGFDIQFTESFVLLEKQSSDYKLELGTVIDEIGSLAFVLEKGDGGWGVAVGLQVDFDDLDNLSESLSGEVKKFQEWFPFDTLTLAISSVNDSNFTFPNFKNFDGGNLGDSKIQLPAIADGIQKGFSLYTSTTFSKENKILGALIELLKIPEGTKLDAFISYLIDKEQLQLGLAITTFLHAPKGVKNPTCNYKNSCLAGTLMFIAGGSDGMAISMMADLKTTIEKQDLEFIVMLTVVANGIFASGTMKTPQPVHIGPFQLADLALELGISFEGIPSFGFSGELEVDGLFDSSLAVLVDTENPAECMIAGALSDLCLGDIVLKLCGEVGETLPQEIQKALDTVAIKGTKEGAFTVTKSNGANDLIEALNHFDGEVISKDFVEIGKQSSFPDSSSGMMIFNDSENGKWYITEKAGTGQSSTITHWQLVKNSKGDIDVSKEAQFYFVPSPAGANIGAFFYPQGIKVSGALDFFFIKADVDVEIELNNGFKVDASIDKISFVSDSFFSIKAEDGSGGPQLSICTYSQPNQSEKFQGPHFFVNGNLTLLGASRAIFADVSEKGIDIELEGSYWANFINGHLSGQISEDGMELGGIIKIGIDDIDLGPLGTWKIKTGVDANASIFAKIEEDRYGAYFDCSFEFGGKTHTIGKIKLDVIDELPKLIMNKVEKILKELFKDVKYWIKMAVKELHMAREAILNYLENNLNMSPEAAKFLLDGLGLLCPIVTAVNLLGAA